MVNRLLSATGFLSTDSEDRLTSTRSIPVSALPGQEAQSVGGGCQERVARRRALEQQVELLQLLVAVQRRVWRREAAERIGYLQAGEEPLRFDRGHVTTGVPGRAAVPECPVAADLKSAPQPQASTGDCVAGGGTLCADLKWSKRRRLESRRVHKPVLSECVTNA